ncbi:MAG: hypothetical protein B7Z73_02185 [Planctomycetia bacterium 21-64-5]|nr:MAG: hypothetical protein B7Z73_02185 [Planctomycetia bacterium 21-64-5]HQU43358.1 hypothetical protein [Pirellulales bacterium]
MRYQLLASTVRRTTTRTWARGGEEAGEIWQLEVDVDRLTLDVVHRLKLPSFHVSPLERFAGKGIAVLDDAVAVATYDSVCLYDRSLGQLLAQRSHRLMGDLHSLSVNGEFLYATSPLANAILALDGDLNVVWTYLGHDDDELCQRVGLTGDARARPKLFAGQAIDYRFYTGKDLDLFHFNHHFFFNGELIVNVPSRGRLWNVTRGDWFLPQFSVSGAWDGCFHDGVYLPKQGHYVSYTDRGTVNKHHPRTGALMGSVSAVPDHQKCDPARRGWLRGLMHLEGELFLLGQSGPSFGLVDFKEQVVRKWWSFGDDQFHSFFALTKFQAARGEAGRSREQGRGSLVFAP